MGWASEYIKDLQAGRTVEFRPVGRSMTPYIESGQLVTVKPMDQGVIQAGSIVLCTVNGCQYLHFVKDIQIIRGTVKCLIGNAHGGINGWIETNLIFGIYTQGN